MLTLSSTLEELNCSQTLGPKSASNPYRTIEGCPATHTVGGSVSLNERLTKDLQNDRVHLYHRTTSGMCPSLPAYATYPPNTVQEVVAAWQEGIERLLARGVTGRILLANSASPKGFPVSGVCITVYR